MFNSINFQKITTTSLLAILMAGNLIVEPAISGNGNSGPGNNNGHGNNCDGIDSSNPGNGSPNGRNPNHIETYPNVDDEGRGNCSTNTQSNNGNVYNDSSTQTQPDMIKLSFLTGEFQCGRNAPLAEFEMTITTQQNSSPITLRVGESAFVEASNLQDLDIDIEALSGGSCISWSGLAAPVFMGSSDSFPNYINPAHGTYNQTPLNEFQEQLSVSEGFMLMELGGHRRYTTHYRNRNRYDWNDIVLLYNLDPNLPPQVTEENLSITVDNNTPTPINVISNYVTDPEGDTVTIDKVAVSVNGTETSLASTDTGSLNTPNGQITIENGQIRYTPNRGFSGDESFTYTVADAEGNEASGQITVSVLPNQPPTVNEYSPTVTIDYETATTIDILGQYVNDPDDTLTIDNVTVSVNGTETTLSSIGTQGISTANGQITIESGQIVYTPDEGFSGSDNFGYTVVDSAGNPASDTITVSVNPLANDFTVTTPYNTATTIDEQIFGDHVGGNTLTIEKVTVLVNGAEQSLTSTDTGSLTTPNGSPITIQDGQIVYTSGPGFSDNSESFYYTVKDSSGNEASGEITVNVGAATIVYGD